MVVNKNISEVSLAGTSTVRFCSEALVAVPATGQSPDHLLSPEIGSQSSELLRGWGWAGGDLDHGWGEIKATGNTERSLH